MIAFANLLSVLLTFLIESWISPGCSYEFHVVYVKREKSQYLLCTVTTYEIHTFKNKNKTKVIIEKHFCLSIYRLYLVIGSRKFVLKEKGVYDIPYDENAMSSLIVQSIL